ncbi:MAG TPA: hybrid sensor histidine kinase/response regulator [Verrucomicrobiae bacterium]|nr:hybrid sensor histidine kinase/response regulator [Verrucomicrobiae bacterium]
MKKILVIDDEAWLREMMLLALSQRGFEVIEAGDGEVGIERARKDLPDLILCDVNMERVDGYQTLSTLRNDAGTASIPFILMTGLADQAGMRQGMELGADDYLSKPFTIDGLYAAVDARLKKLQVVRQEAEKKLADLRDNISMMLPHELRTPLNGILAYGEILMADSGSLQPNEIAEMGQVISESGKRLQRLIENFVIYTQIELLAADPRHQASLARKSTVCADNFIEERLRNLAANMRRPEDLALDLASVAVPMSEDYLGKVVDELVQNAFKFSKPGTKVSVSLYDMANSVTLIVTDEGRGFSSDQISRIGAYMQFDRKMQEQQGSGLGLAIAKRLTELHGGTLTIQSDKGANTNITVKLPKPTATATTTNGYSH